MACEQKARLLLDYKTTTEKFAAAVIELHQKMGTSPITEYERLQRLADEARVKSEQARLALEAHSATHRC